MTVHAPPYAKGADKLTAAIAVTPFKDGDFDIDCDGCTACCHGDDGPIILDSEYHDYACHKDDKGNMRLDQVDGHCVYLAIVEDSEGVDHIQGCAIHAMRDPATILDGPAEPPKICRDFDCRSIIIKFNNRGLDYMVNSKQLPLDVVIQGRAKLKQFNDMINTRALSGGADLSGLLMAPAEEEGHAPDAA